MLLATGAAVDTPAADEHTPLVRAASEDHSVATRPLLDAGADVALRGGYGRSALDCAAQGGHVDLLREVIEHRVNLNSTSDKGTTALHLAAFFNHAAAIDALVEAGANIKAKDNGSTPLHVAATNRSPAAVLALLKHGASINQQNTAGNPPLHRLCSDPGQEARNRAGGGPSAEMGCGRKKMPSTENAKHRQISSGL